MKAPEKSRTAHVDWKCFICKKVACKSCKKPYYSKIDKCKSHPIGECTHHEFSIKLKSVNIKCCNTEKCKNRMNNLIRRPTACVKQNFKIQVEKMVNHAVYYINPGSSLNCPNLKKDMFSDEHSYGNIIQLHTYDLDVQEEVDSHYRLMNE